MPLTSQSELPHLLRFVFDPHKRVLEMITSLTAKIDIDAFAPPLEHRALPQFREHLKFILRLS